MTPEYFLHDPKPAQEGQAETKHEQPQCTEGTDCEPYCIAACEAEHPTTVIDAAIEGAGEILDDIIAPLAEDVLGIPVSGIGSGIMWGTRIAMIVAGIVVILKVRQGMRALGLGKKIKKR